MIVFVLTTALMGMPMPAEDASHAPSPGISRFSEGGLKPKPEAEALVGKEGEVDKDARADAKKDARAAAKNKALAKAKGKADDKTKKVVEAAREDTAEMLSEVRNVISSIEKGEPVQPDVTVVPKDKEDGHKCDLMLPQELAFELERVRALRDETMIMLEMHEENLKQVQDKLEELESTRKQLDKSRALLEESLTRRSSADDEQEQERRRLRLLLASRAMKPKKIAALIEEVSADEARVLLEALPENAMKAVLESLPPERLSFLVSPPSKGAKAAKSEATNTSTKPKEGL